MSENNPYAAPKAKVSDVERVAQGADIARLPVAESWKTKFRLMQRAGGPALPKMTELSFSERSKIGFNVLAFLFGPIYYAIKGMWRKAITLFALGAIVITLLAIVLDLMELARFSRSLGFGWAAIYAARADADYYKKMVLGENGWW